VEGRLRSASRALAIIASCLTAAAGSSPAWSAFPDETAPDLTAAFILNFVLYTDWPAEALGEPGEPLVISIAGERSLADHLRQLFAGRTVDARNVEVRHVARPDTIEGLEALRDSHVVFIGSAHRERAQWILDRIEGANALTIGCFPGFAHDGGMLNLRVLGRKMRFEANFDAIQHGGVSVNSEVLRLADLVGPAGAGDGLR